MGDLNLIPADRLNRKRLRARVGVWAGVYSFVLVLIAGVVVSANFCMKGASSDLEQGLEAVDQNIEEYNSTAVELGREISKARLELEVAQAAGVQADWGRLLSLLAEQLGDEVILSGCHLVESGAENVKAAEAGTDEKGTGEGTELPGQHYELRLSGFGRGQMSVSSFLLRLERMEFFKSVRLLSSNRQAFLDGYAVVFTVVCSI